MKIIKSKKIQLFLALFIGISANSMAADIRIWDNQQGLIAPVNCKAETSSSIPFIVTSAHNKKDTRYEYLRNQLGIEQSNLASGSIAKVTNQRIKNNYTSIQVIGVNNLDGLNQNKWFSKKGDSGYLYNKSMDPLEDYLIQVRGIKDLNYLMIYQTNGYHYLNCNKRKYYIFKNYQSLNSSAVGSLVAISEHETSIFNNIQTLPVDNFTNPLLKDFVSEDENSEEPPIPYINDMDFKTVDEEVLEILDVDYNPKSNSQEGLEIAIAEDNVLCVPSDKLNIRDESLENVLFQAVSGEVVQVFQTFDKDDVIKQDIGGIEYSFVRIKFTNREEKDQNIGRVAKRFVLPKSKCKYLPTERSTLDREKLKITGLSDKLCCDFPTIKKVTHPYTSGMRKFNANRGKGTRKHAACDLYRVKNEAIVAVAPGTVIRDLYYFYQGTYAVEVLHQGGFIVRYGEITGKKVDGIKAGETVNMGDRLGYVGVVNSNCCLPMLHFEMFKGDKTGPLSVGGNKYQRRSDLMDPTSYLEKWEGMTFNE